MKRIFYLALVLVLGVLILSGCTSEKANGQTNNTFEQITAEEAKAIIDSEESYVILDVRTKEEFESGHIEGAILIPDYEIRSQAESVLNDKDELILVYCRSGNRSKNAAKELAALGYTNVKDFGGIMSWKYDIVTD